MTLRVDEDLLCLYMFHSSAVYKDNAILDYKIYGNKLYVSIFFTLSICLQVDRVEISEYCVYSCMTHNVQDQKLNYIII